MTEALRIVNQFHAPALALLPPTAPVSLQSYTKMIEWQTALRTPPTFDQIRNTINGQLVLSEHSMLVAAMTRASIARISSRSLVITAGCTHSLVPLNHPRDGARHGPN